MNADDAKKLLLQHSFGGPEGLDDPKAEGGFLGSLRPYRGLREENFHEVMEAIRVLGPSLSCDSQLDREVVNAIWGICYLARLWGVHPEGMLRRNGLISPEDLMRLERWIETISWTVFSLLDGADVDAAFEGYNGRSSA